jgi:hypothetical protein
MQAATISAIAAAVSAAVAVGSAIGALIAARRSRSDKKQAETRANEALKASQAVAAAVGRIAEAQESHQTSVESRQTAADSVQAVRVGFVPSPVQRGRTGWRIKNDSDDPVTSVDIRTTTGAKIVVYRGSGPDHEDHYGEPVLSAHQTTQMMFRPADSDAAAADPSEIERMRVRFTDARDQVWERIGSQPPRRVDS